MIQAGSQKIRLRPSDLGGGLISVPVSQLENVRQLLDQGSIYYWVDSTTIGSECEEHTAFVTLSRYVDMDRVRALLNGLL